MAGRRKKSAERAEFPALLVVSVSGTADRPYFTVHQNNFENVVRDTVVGVYKLKRVSQITVSRALERLPKE